MRCLFERYTYTIRACVCVFNHEKSCMHLIHVFLFCFVLAPALAGADGAARKSNELVN